MAGHSTQPTLEQIRGVFRLLGDIRDLRDDPPQWQARMAAGLCDLLGMRQGTTLVMEGFPGRAPRLVGALHGGDDARSAAAIWEHKVHLGGMGGDIIAQRSCGVPGEVVAVLREQVVPDGDFYASPMVRDLADVTDVESHLLGWHRGGPRLAVTVGVTFQRERRRRATQREREVLRLFFEELRLLRDEGKLDPPARADLGPRLSRRERQVGELLARGDSVKQVAAGLGISGRTVENYVKALYRKYGVSSRGEFVARWVTRG